MNVLASHPPAAPAASAAPPASATADAPAGFGRLLAEQVGSTSPRAATSDAPAATGSCTTAETPAGECGTVAAAVQAAIAAWRADPEDMGLGTHLRHTLEGTVRQVAASPAAAGPTSSSAAPPAAGDEAPAGTSMASVVAPAEGAATSVVGASGPGAGPDVPSTPAGGPGTVTTDQMAAQPEAPSIEGRPAPAPVPTAAPTPAPATSDAGPAAATPMPVSAEGAIATTGEPDTDAPRLVEPRAPVPEQAADPSTPSSAGHDTSAGIPDVAATTRSEPFASTPRPGGPLVTSGATLDRVLRAVEALEHAPPPRRLSIEVEGVQLTVAMQGEEVTVAVRTGADQLAPGWQRDLASALRGRGLDLAADAGSTSEQGDGHHHAPTRDHESGSPVRTRPHRPTQAAEPAGLRL